MLVLKSIRCSNFTSFQDLELNVPLRATVLIEGPNDAGKSNLIDAVRFGLTGLPPAGRTTDSMIRYGEFEGAVSVNFVGDFGTFTVERTAIVGGSVHSKLMLDNLSEVRTVEDDKQIAEQIARLTNFDADELCSLFFIDSANTRRASNEMGRGKLPLSILPQRTDLDRVSIDLKDVTDLKDIAARANDRVQLAECWDRLRGLKKIRTRAEQLLKIVYVRRAQLDFQAADLDLKSLTASKADWVLARSELNVRIDSAERRSATSNLVDGILKTWDEREMLARTLEETTSLIDQAGQKWSALVHERNKLAKLDRALLQLAEARAADGRVTAATKDKDKAESVFTELENLDLERTMLEEKRELDWARENSRSRPDFESDPNNSEGATMLWKAWLTALAFDGEEESKGLHNWRSAIAARFRRERKSDRTEGAYQVSDLTGEPPEIGLKEIEAALTANGIRVPRDLDDARTLIGNSPQMAQRDSNQVNGRETGTELDPNSKAKSMYWRITQIDERITTLRQQADAIDLAPLQAVLTHSIRERDAARESAANALAGLDIDLDLNIIEDEFDFVKQRLTVLEDGFGEQPDLELKREKLAVQERQVRDDGERLVGRLRKLNGGASVGEDVDRETLEQLRDEGRLGADVQNVAVLDRELSQISERILAIETDVAETKRAADSSLTVLTRRCAQAGITLDVSDIAGSIQRALPQASKLTGSESSVLESEVERLTKAIAKTQASTAQLELRVGPCPNDQDLAATRSEVERLEREIITRQQAAAIAKQASSEQKLRAVNQATRIARTLVPAFTGNTYFDIHLPVAGGVELWDEENYRWVSSTEVSIGLQSQVDVTVSLAAAVTSNQFRETSGCRFLFLDDPIWGADKSRGNQIASAIVNGCLRHEFEQLFIITATDCLDKRMFDYVLLLEDGKVTASSLPMMAEATASA